MTRHRSSHGNRRALESWVDEHPIATTRDLLISSFGRYALEQAVSSSALVRLLPRIYAGANHVDSPEVRTQACALWAPRGSAFGGATALALHGGKTLPEQVHLVVPPHARADAPAWLRVRWLQTHPVVAGRYGAMLAPGFALVDAWHRAPKRSREDVFYRALWDRTVTAAEAAAALPRFPRVRDRRRLERLLELASTGATSPLEVLAKVRVFTGARFRAFEWQAPLRAGGRERLVDMLHRAAKVAIEFDGRAYHDSEEGWFSDRERDVELSAAGFTTLRFTYRDLTTRPQWCRSQVLAAVQIRSLSDNAA